MKTYTSIFEQALTKNISFFKNAKSKGYRDLRNICEITFVQTLEQKVEYLLKLKGIRERISELKNQISKQKMAILICEDFISGKFGKMEKINMIETCVRCVVCIMTDGVVSAPLEGIPKIAQQKNTDGSTYVEIYYAGPIRAAGGTASVLSVLVCEYMARKLNYAKYQATQDELERYCGEIKKYMKIHPRIRFPTVPEIKGVVKNCFVCITGVASEIEQVDSYKYLPRVKTPKLRGGMVLVISDGIILKYRKLIKYTVHFNLDWTWLQNLVSTQKTPEKNKDDLNPEEPKFLQTVSIGKPVLSRSNCANGFRIRLCRTRNSGLGTRGMNPLTMKLLKFVNLGTQFIIEKPGKALAVAPHTALEPARVKLATGDFIVVNTPEIYEKVKNKIAEIVDLGQIGVPLGDYLENPGNIPVQDISCEQWNKMLKDKKLEHEFAWDSYQKTITFCIMHKLPYHPFLHPMVDYITSEQYFSVRRELVSQNLNECVLTPDSLNVVETLGLLYTVTNKKYCFSHPLVVFNFFMLDLNISETTTDLKHLITQYSNIPVRGKGLNVLDCRIGRVESAIETQVKPKIHGIYEIGALNSGTNVVTKLLNKDNKFKIKLRARYCSTCKKITHKPHCCRQSTCYMSNTSSTQNIVLIDDPLEKTDFLFKEFTIDLSQDYLQGFLFLKEKLGDNIIKVSNKAIFGIYEFEPVEKIILRAKYDLSAWKDGTTRYTFSNLTLTHFKPCEINCSVKKLKQLGYTQDIYKQPLFSSDQIIELKPSDVVVNRACLNYFYRVSKFLDELLVKFYGVKSFYNIFSPFELIGHYFLGLSPHTCAAVVCRVIGFTNANVLYAHPIFHAAKRRNCDGDGDTIFLMGDAILNYSQAFMRRGNGAKMNVPLMICTKLILSEVDNEAKNVDIYSEYPENIFTGIHTTDITTPEILKYKHDNEINMLNMSYTTENDNICIDTTYNAYKEIHQTRQKLLEQFKLCSSIRNLKNQTIVFEKVLKTHLIPDIVGNIRSYLKQNFRCGVCKTSYRAPTLNGICRFCNSPLKLTVYPNSVQKYMPYVDMICSLYTLDKYTKQKIELFKQELKQIFHTEKQTQLNLLRFKK